MKTSNFPPMVSRQTHVKPRDQEMDQFYQSILGSGVGGQRSSVTAVYRKLLVKNESHDSCDLL